MSLTRVPKVVWFDDVLWTVVKHFAPNKHDDYLALSREDEHTAHKDCPRINMTLIDCHNDEFYPDNTVVRKEMARRRAAAKVKGTDLSGHWLAMVREQG